MREDRKHRELIIQWANGANIQTRTPGSQLWHDVKNPSWSCELEYRVKPEKNRWVITLMHPVAFNGVFYDKVVVNEKMDTDELMHKLESYNPKLVTYFDRALSWDEFTSIQSSSR